MTPRRKRLAVTVLGSGTAAWEAGRGCAGLYVEAAGQRVLLDAGPGTIRQLVRAEASYRALDLVALTHFHPDHALDLATLLFSLRIPTRGPLRSLTVTGPRGLRALYARLNAAFSGSLAPRGYRLALREVERAVIRRPGLRVTSRPMRHLVPAVGYRIDSGGASIAYSGDTDVCGGIVELGRGADLLILECSMTDERKVSGHLTPTECGRIAAAAGCRRLLLTHFYPVFDGYDIRGRVRASYRGPVMLARDLLRIEV